NAKIPPLGKGGVRGGSVNILADLRRSIRKLIEPPLAPPLPRRGILATPTISAPLAVPLSISEHTSVDESGKLSACQSRPLLYPGDPRIFFGQDVQHIFRECSRKPMKRPTLGHFRLGLSDRFCDQRNHIARSISHFLARNQKRADEFYEFAAAFGI